MITRRAFLSALAALPLVGRLVPRPQDANVFGLYSPTSHDWIDVPLGAPRVYIYSIYHDVDPRDAEAFSGDEWPANTRDERISASGLRRPAKWLTTAIRNKPI